MRTDRKLYDATHGPISKNSPACSGTTALTAFIWGDQLIVANAGDCRAVMCRRGKAIELTNDHRSSNPEESLRVRAAGGWICPEGYLNGHLAVLRALGDHHFTDLKAPSGPDETMQGPLTAEPEVASQAILPEDEFIIMACDGFWDVFSSQRAVECARQQLRDHNDPQLCSQQLVRLLAGLLMSCGSCLIAVLFPARPHGYYSVAQLQSKHIFCCICCTCCNLLSGHIIVPLFCSAYWCVVAGR